MINPADAAVAARSFPRRWREIRSAEDAPAHDAELESLEREASDALAAELSALGGLAAPSLEATAHALGEAIDSIDHDRWRDAAQLASLDRAITAAADALRRAERLVAPAD